MKQVPKKVLPALRCLSAALLFAFGGGFATMAEADASPRVIRISNDSMVGNTTVVKGTSETFRISVPFTEIVVADPETADVNPLTDRTLYVLGRKLGTTNVTLFDERKRLVAVIDIEVTHDLTGLRKALKSAIPSSSLKVTSVNGRVLIDGQVPSAPAAEKAIAIARDFAGDDVTNSLSIASLQQVNLEVRMIEVARSAGKELGFNWNLVNNGNGFAQGSGVVSDAADTAATKGLLAVAGSLSSALPFGTVVANILDNGTSPDLLISALESRNLARRLAEPNLTALSGEQANFQAGGEVPVQTCQGTLAQRDCSVTYKDFGVKLDFTPTVLDDGLINLLIAPEVSEIDPTISVDGNPGFVTRRAKTSVELRDGQSFAIAGLLQSLNAKTASQVPWAGDVPIIGTLFRSSAFQKKESDLVIIVTPRLVRPVGTRQQLQAPLDSMAPSNEPEFFLLGQQEVSKKSLDVKYNGVYGHIIDLPKVDHGSPQK